MGRGKADVQSSKNMLLGQASPRSRAKAKKSKVHKQRVLDSKGRQIELGSHAIDEDGKKLLVKDFISSGTGSGILRINVIDEQGREYEGGYAEELMAPPRTFKCYSLRAE